MAGFVDRNGPLSYNKKSFTLRDQLKKLSFFGMYYDDLVLRQSQAIGPIEDAIGFGQTNQMGVDSDDMYGAFAALSMSDTTMRKNIPFFDQNYESKRNELRAFSTYDEIEDILDILCDESVVYDNKNFFATPELIGMDVSEEVEKYLHKKIKYESKYETKLESK